MARKKLTTDLSTSTPAETVQQEQPKTSRTKKAVYDQPAQSPTPADNPATTTKPKARRARKLEEEAAQALEQAAPVLPEPSTDSSAKAARPSRKLKVEPSSEQSQVEATGGTKRPARSKKAEPGPEPALFAVEQQMPKLKSEGKAKRAAKGAQVEESAAAPSGATDDLPIPTWRARQPKNGQTSLDKTKTEEREARGSRRRRGRTTDKAIEITETGAVEVPAEAVSQETEPQPLGPGEDVMVSFRPRSGSSVKAPEAKTSTIEPYREGSERPRRERGRERTRTPRAEQQPVPEVEEKAQTPVARAKPEEPKPLVKPFIPTPEDAPQVVLREGVPTLVRKGRVLPPMLFFGSSTDERRAQTVLEELKMACEAGIHIHSHLIEFEVDRNSVDSAAAVAAYILKKTVEIDPQAQVIFRMVFQAPRNWDAVYPKAKYSLMSGGMAEPSICDEEFWGVARECLTLFVKKLRLLEFKDNILGVHLERGEWFQAADWGYDDSLAAKLKFREWAEQRYINDEVALRASWFDGDIRFDNIVVPRYNPEGSEGDKFVRSSRKQRKYVDYHLFLSDATVHRISDLAYAVKEASSGYFLVGVSYGYTFEWSHPSSGHLSLGKLLRTPEIDFIAGPPSYRTREPSGSAPFPGPVDSYALNGKLFISEEDFKTSLSGGHEPDDFNPVIKTPQALENIHWRGVGAALAHSSGMAWMDLWGNGWLKTSSIWQRAKKVISALTERMACPAGDPEVVVFIDERALAYLVDENAFRLLVQNVRESVLRAGVSAGFYLLSDLAHREKFPEAKLYLFLNAWDIRPELRAAIKSRLQRDNKVLFWLYSAGLFDAGRDSLERAREVTGIALKPQPFHSKSGTTMLARRHPLTAAFPDRYVHSDAQLEPSYFAIPEDATVLGEYSQTGLPSFVVRDFVTDGQPQLNWTSVFLGEPAVNPALIRALAQMAGAHVFNFQDDVVHVRQPFLTVHCTGTGQRSIALPNKWSAYDLLADSWVALEGTMLRFTGIDGTTHCFLAGPREELQHLLDADKGELLKMAVLPPKQDNLRREDGLAFDVPIMKLDAWIESSDSEESADDWFLRPQQVLEEPEGESEKVGRRRGRRRRDRGRGGSEESANARSEPSGTVVSEQFDDALGMSVMFRKRD